MHLISISPRPELRKDEKDNKTRFANAIFIKTEEGMSTIVSKFKEIMIRVEPLMTEIDSVHFIVERISCHHMHSQTFNSRLRLLALLSSPSKNNESNQQLFVLKSVAERMINKLTTTAENATAEGSGTSGQIKGPRSISAFSSEGHFLHPTIIPHSLLGNKSYLSVDTVYLVTEEVENMEGGFGKRRLIVNVLWVVDRSKTLKMKLKENRDKKQQLEIWLKKKTINQGQHVEEEINVTQEEEMTKRRRIRKEQRAALV